MRELRTPPHRSPGMVRSSNCRSRPGRLARSFLYRVAGGVIVEIGVLEGSACFAGRPGVSLGCELDELWRSLDVPFPPSLPIDHPRTGAVDLCRPPTIAGRYCRSDRCCVAVRCWQPLASALWQLPTRVHRPASDGAPAVRGPGVLRKAGAAAAGCPLPRMSRGEKHKGNLRLDSREAVLHGGDTGPAIVPGKPDESLLVDAIRYGETYQMPPKGRLPDEEVAMLVDWVRRGAPWPADNVSRGHGIRRPCAFDFADGRRHWCFQPLATCQPPAVTDTAWPRNAIDHFILAGLEARGLQPAAAGRQTRLAAPRDVRSDRPAARRRPRSRIFSLTNRRRRMKKSSTDCWPRRIMANARPGIGSTWRDLPKPTVTSTTMRFPTPIPIATI